MLPRTDTLKNCVTQANSVYPPTRLRDEYRYQYTTKCICVSQTCIHKRVFTGSTAGLRQSQLRHKHRAAFVKRMTARELSPTCNAPWNAQTETRLRGNYKRVQIQWR